MMEPVAAAESHHRSERKYTKSRSSDRRTSRWNPVLPSDHQEPARNSIVSFLDTFLVDEISRIFYEITRIFLLKHMVAIMRSSVSRVFLMLSIDTDSQEPRICDCVHTLRCL